MKSELKIFFVILIFVSLIFQGIIIAKETAAQSELFEHSQYWVYLLMWTPAISALIASRGKFIGQLKLIREINFKVLLYPVILIGIFLIASWLIGDGIVIKLMKQNYFRLKTQGFLEHSLILFILFASSAGEEIGWRGYLYPKLRSFMSHRLASLSVGTIWGLWHIPIILGTQYSAEYSVFISVICFLGLTISMSFYMGKVFEQGRSVLNFVFLHGVHNYIVYFWLLGSQQRENQPFLYSEFGVLLPIICAFIYFATRSNSLKNH